MKKILLLILAIFLMALCVSVAKAQDDPHTGQTYIALAPAFYTSSTGGGGLQASAAQRVTFDVEVGRQWSVLSLGLDLGKTTLQPNIGKDTVTGVVPAGKWYLELRPNLNVFQQGKFTNTMTIGAGYVFGSNQYLLTELTTGIEYDPNPTFSYNLNVGTYYFTGDGVGSNQVFFGFSAMYFFKSKKNHRSYARK